ncbi:hypothetical protein [Entomospira culicis]|uniref:Uncharacterized protein n=1 Tax=Entomospira culicis TaxID=2719989 RepID=A0A968GLQ8_9SPIO|nr:hypothetical protein [Entomospira culicis]NIZ19938.1 hypothetical protein [Entomospira culicis]NIZ70105.1 hypothetical protein [Entomospira culicis]WDI38032.1 hypothetical protein PVA46_07790 [Entomospira culicis]WDI39655.1 hypothetical protein PVA47_07790 [Entomospira culicis]
MKRYFGVLVWLWLMPASSLFAMGHIVSLRLGGSIDKNIGLVAVASNPLAMQRNTASFGVGVSYDWLIMPFLALTPSFHSDIHRTNRATLVDGSSLKSSWHEVGGDLQLKFTALGYFYTSAGLGVRYATVAKSNQALSQASKSSVYPYLVGEIGGNIPLNGNSFGDMDGSTVIAFHIAFRYTRNLYDIRNPMTLGTMQNRQDFGIYVGLSFGWLYDDSASPLSDYY